MALCTQVADRTIISPMITKVMDGVVEIVQSTITLVKSRIFAKTAEEKEKELIEKESKGARREITMIETGKTETVEPILDYFCAYSTDAMSLVFTPFMIWFYIQFRTVVQSPVIWLIRSNDMTYYLLFAFVIVFFQFCADTIIHNVLEVMYRWKIYDYLVYTRYRFLQRETRWKGMEESLDECIDENMRTLDQMCFSSQYYLILTVAVTGMMLFALSIEIMLRVQYNLFQDPATGIVILVILVFCKLIVYLSKKFADYMGIWLIKHAATAWHSGLGDDEDAEFGVPDWDELDAPSHEAFIMENRIGSETFRHKFLDYNRPWLVAQLPSILTPRTLRRSRPYLIAQFTKLLGSVNADVSEDSEEEEKEKEFGPVTMSGPSRVLLRLWLAQARRRRKLKDVVAPIIAARRLDQCEQCLSRRQLNVILVIPIEQLGDAFEAQYPGMKEFDQVLWKQFFQKHETFRTLCQSCIGKNADKDRAESAGHFDGLPSRDAPASRFPPMSVTAAQRSIMSKWVKQARTRIRTGRAGRATLGATVVDVSDDDAAEEVEAAPAWARVPVRLSASSRALAARWLALARSSARPADRPGERDRPEKDGRATRYRRK